MKNFKFNRHFYIFLIFLRSTLFWICWLLFRRDMPLSVAMIYRERGQDIEYFPYMSGLMTHGLRDAYDYIKQGTGIVSFPFGSVWFHSIFFKVFGVLGMALADFIVATTVFILLSKLFQQFKIKEFIADTLSLFVVIGVSGKLAGLSKVLHLAMGPYSTFFELMAYLGFVFCICQYLMNQKFNPIWLLITGAGLLFSNAWVTWEYFTWRFPRPFVTEIYFLAFILLTLRVSLLKNIFNESKNWILLGITSAFLVQSEIYEFFYCGLLLGSLALIKLNKETKVSEVIKSFLFFTLPFFILSMPFFIQRLYETKDVPGRFGLFKVSHFKPFLAEISNYDLYRFTLIGFLCFYVFKRFNEKATDEGERHFLLNRKMAIFSALFLGLFTIPLFSIFTGTVVEAGHFYYLLRYMTTLIILIGIGMLLTQFANKRVANIKSKFILFCIALIGIVNVAKDAHKSFTFTDHTRNDFEEYSHFKNYQKNFSDLIKKLDEFPSHYSISTYDMQVFEWWTALKHGKAFTSDVFSSSLTDSEVEDRLITLNRILGFQPEEFVTFLNQGMTTYFFFTCLKYQLIQGYMYSKWEDYLPEDQKNYWSTSVISMNTAIPISERNRLKEKFILFPDPKSQDTPDLIVLQQHPTLDAKKPNEALYIPVYSNDIFRVWKKKN